MDNTVEKYLEKREKALAELEKSLEERENKLIEKEKELENKINKTDNSSEDEEIQRILEESRLEYIKLRPENSNSKLIITLLVCLILTFITLTGRTIIKTKDVVGSYSNNSKVSVELDLDTNSYKITDYQNITNQGE